MEYYRNSLVGLLAECYIIITCRTSISTKPSLINSTLALKVSPFLGTDTVRSLL